MGISSSSNRKKRNEKEKDKIPENKEINNISEINIIYDINKKNELIENDKNNINIFGSEFVKINRNICKMIIDNNEYEITEKYNVNSYNKNILQVKLKGINNVTNMTHMFYGCSSLLYLPDI